MVCPRGSGVSGLPTGFDILLKFFVNFPNMGRPDEVKLPSLGKSFIETERNFLIIVKYTKNYIEQTTV
jgi:hypothetical protein